MSTLNIQHSDHNREGLTPVKIIHLFQVLFNKKATEVLTSVKKFGDINFSLLKKEGKEGVILDIDECVAPHHGEILPENEEIIKRLLGEGWKVVIFSNMKKSNRYEKLEELGIRVITSKYAKPDKRGFMECLDSMEMSPKSVVMIGDNFLTDGGSIQAGIDFVKVEPIITEGNNGSISRVIQVFMRSVVDRVAIVRGNI